MSELEQRSEWALTTATTTATTVNGVIDSYVSLAGIVSDGE